MDALSDVLRAVRLTGAVFFDVARVRAVGRGDAAGRVDRRHGFPGRRAPHLLPRGHARHVLGDVVGEPPRPPRAGDMIVFPHGDAHVMSSAPGMRRHAGPRRCTGRRATGSCPFTMTMGERAADERRDFVCGFLGCDARPFNPLLAALPRVIRVSERRAAARSARSCSFAVAESKKPRLGGECVLGRLSELMFVEVVRRYLESLPADRTGWLAGLRDPFVGRALAALHGSPAREWTLEALAREVGAVALRAGRALHAVGRAAADAVPGELAHAAGRERLLSGTDNVAEVAERVGYESEAAFSRAFKKAVGVPPGQWRKRGGASGQA